MLSDIAIERAGDEDLAFCLALVPNMAGADIVHLVARRGGESVGAAAIEWQDRHDGAGFPLDIHVVPWARRQGIGTALCKAAMALIRDEGDGAWSREGHEVGSVAYRFLERSGFVPARRYYFYDAVLADYRAYVVRGADRVRARGATGIDIVPLHQAPLDQVALLVTAHFASSPIPLLHDLIASAGSDRLSRVALRDGRVAGVLIGREQGRSVVIDAWAVGPRDRRGAVSPLLFDACLAAATAAGIVRIEFHCDDLTRDTIAAAARGAVLVAERHRLFRAT